MKDSSIFAIAATSIVALSACTQERAAAPVDVRAAMQQHVNPATLAIWDIGNNAMDDAGGIDPAMLDDAKWATLAESAAQLATASKVLAAGQNFIAAAADNAAVAEGEIAMAAVQQHLDADPDGFRQSAAALAEHADKLTAAAKGRDATLAGDLVTQLDGFCENCHSRFWYPK